MSSAWPLACAVSLVVAVGADVPRAVPASAVHPEWRVSADSEETIALDGRAVNAIDGNPGTIWHTTVSGPPDPLPHHLAVDTGVSQVMSGLSYLPRPRRDGRDGTVGRFEVHVSDDGLAWGSPVAKGLLADTSGPKTIAFAPTTARHFRLTVLSEAGGRGPWTTVAEVDLVDTRRPAPAAGTGRWSRPINLPLVPVAAAVLPDSKVLLWSSYLPDDYAPGARSTHTAVYDPATGTVESDEVTETGHDMFCPGTALLADGRLLVNGGDSEDKTSLYDARTRTWSRSADLVLPRGYQSAAALSDGRVFTVGGSWNEGSAVTGLIPKHGEVWSATGGSRALPGASMSPFVTADPDGVYRSDNHAWLFAWKDGRVFHAGPSRAMGWFGTEGEGSVTPAGHRGSDGDAMNGNAVMYDVGKVLTVGGAPGYSSSVATAHAHAIDINGVEPTVRALDPMAHPRAFSSSVVLPDGKVIVVGGQGYAKPFSDATAVLQPELWDPATGRFTEMAPLAVPRTYHSMATLLPDGRVLAGGGGLCGGCGNDHLDAEVYTPPYLLDGQGRPRSRPAITRAPKSAAAGATVLVSTNRTVASFALVRTSSVTHSVNTDQRRVPLRIVRSTPTRYSLALPADRGVLIPGTYLLFALDRRGVPSVAATMSVR